MVEEQLTGATLELITKIPDGVNMGKTGRVGGQALLYFAGTTLFASLLGLFLPKLLNFGHTIGHGVESAARGSLYHGECVALGMVPMCGREVRERLIPLLERLSLPTACDLDKEAIWQAMQHDKKSSSSGFSAVFVEKPGQGFVKQVSFAEMKAILEGAWQA